MSRNYLRDRESFDMSAFLQLIKDNSFALAIQELKAKGIDSEQYNILGRGDLAQCTADAQQTVRRTFSIADCTEAFSSGSPFVAQDCTARQEAAKRDSTQMYKDLTLGCMAKRGWLWTRTAQ